MHLEKNLLGVYRARHHQWPTNLEDVERDLESDAYRDYPNVHFDRTYMIEAYRNYRPHMTVLYKGNNYLQVRVVFTKGFFYRGVFTTAGYSEDPPPDVVVADPLQ